MRYLNPLPTMLAHYERELSYTFATAGEELDRLPSRPVEHARGVEDRWQLLRNASFNRREVLRSDSPVLQLWPSLGLLDYRLLSGGRAPVSLIVHDPVPIRPQFGYDGLSKLVAGSRSSRTVSLVVHSKDARDALDRSLHGRLPISEFLHPVGPLISGEGLERNETPTVLVAGQFKRERDLTLLTGLGPLLQKAGVRGTIVGRGWPQVEGWCVESRFVPEDYLVSSIGRAWVVLIPYSRYFQSGIAVRALEQCRIPVSPRCSFIEDLIGSDHPAIAESVDPSCVMRALMSAIESGESAANLRDQYEERVVRSARRFLSVAKGNR